MHAQAVIEILSQKNLRYGSLRVTVRRGDDAYVDRYFLDCPNGPHDALLHG